MNTDYQKQGEDFLKETGTKMTVKFIAHKKHFADDKESRDIFSITFTRGKVKRSIVFGQSIAQSTGCGDNAPSAYDVLTCLTKQDFADFKDFCESFGYDEDSRKAYRTFKAVQREFQKVNDLGNDRLEELCEIA